MFRRGRGGARGGGGGGRRAGDFDEEAEVDDLA